MACERPAWQSSVSRLAPAARSLSGLFLSLSSDIWEFSCSRPGITLFFRLAMVDRTTYTDADHTPDLPLRQIFGRQRVPPDLCKTVADARLLTVETFAILGDTIAAVKQTLKAMITDPLQFGPGWTSSGTSSHHPSRGIEDMFYHAGPFCRSAGQDGRGSVQSPGNPGRGSRRVS